MLSSCNLTNISKIKNIALLGSWSGFEAWSIKVVGTLALDNITSDDHNTCGKILKWETLFCRVFPEGLTSTLNLLSGVTMP